MHSPNAIAPPPSAAHSQLSTVNSRLFCLNSFRITYIRKNASANPYGSHISKTKDLKPFRITYLQKKGTGEGGHQRSGVIPTERLPRAGEGQRAEGSLRHANRAHQIKDHGPLVTSALRESRLLSGPAILGTFDSQLWTANFRSPVTFSDRIRGNQGGNPMKISAGKQKGLQAV